MKSKFIIVLFILLLVILATSYSRVPFLSTTDKQLSIVSASNFAITSGSQPQRTLEIMKSETDGIANENDSIFWEKDIEKPMIDMSKIYRTIMPAETTDRIFEKLREAIISAGTDYESQFVPGNIFVSFLLSTESIEMNDAALSGALQFCEVESVIISFEKDQTHFRIISISKTNERQKDIQLSDWYYNYNPQYYTFIQMWNDEYIRAQPLIEHSGFWLRHNEGTVPVSLINDSEGRNLLIFMGYTWGWGYQMNITGIGFIYDENKWMPFNWKNSYEVEFCNIAEYEVFTDGFKVNTTKQHRQEYDWKLYENGDISIFNSSNKNEEARFTRLNS
jgi:hypothetical protein